MPEIISHLLPNEAHQLNVNYFHLRRAMDRGPARGQDLPELPTGLMLGVVTVVWHHDSEQFLVLGRPPQADHEKTDLRAGVEGLPTEIVRYNGPGLVDAIAQTSIQGIHEETRINLTGEVHIVGATRYTDQSLAKLGGNACAVTVFTKIYGEELPEVVLNEENVNSRWTDVDGLDSLGLGELYSYLALQQSADKRLI